MAITTVTKDNFESEVLNAEGKVLIDFWASWCGPCQMLSPIVDALSEEVDSVKFCKVNVDDEGSLAVKHNVMSIPTLIVYENGKIVNQSIGVKSKEEIKEMLGL